MTQPIDNLFAEGEHIQHIVGIMLDHRVLLTTYLHLLCYLFGVELQKIILTSFDKQIFRE
jgi:hypothetical protein